jgi:hypothetical protein
MIKSAQIQPIKVQQYLESSGMIVEPRTSHLPLVPYQLCDRGPVKEGCHLETMKSVLLDRLAQIPQEQMGLNQQKVKLQPRRWERATHDQWRFKQ